MKRLLLFVDGAILGGFERFSHRTQTLFGWDCFHLRNIMWAATAFCYCLEAMSVLLRRDVLGIVLGVYFTASCLYYLIVRLGFFPWTCYHDELYRNVPITNIGKEWPFPLGRFSILVCGSILTFKMHGDPGVTATVFIAVALYFDSCNPLPPTKGKFKEWLRSLRTKPLPSPVPDAV